MLTVTLYMREDCHLCEQAKEDLESLQEQYPHRLVEVDIDSDPVLQKAYLVEIPVVEVGPYKLKAPFDRQKLMMTLGAASDRRGREEEPPLFRSAKARRARFRTCTVSRRSAR